MVNKMHSMSVLCFALTLAAYVLVKKLYRRHPYLLLSPALFVPFLMILFMLAFDVSYDTYMEENQWIVWMLGPATVAFAIPIYEYRQVMKNHAIAICLGIVLGMLGGMSRLMPTAEVGFVGMIRDEETLQPFTYAERLPQDLSGRQCFVLDPMLATGGSSIAAIQLLKDKGCKSIRLLCIIAAPEGVKAMQEAHPDVDIYIGALDQKLNDHGYIVPGLGDAGDRIFGTK